MANNVSCSSTQPVRSDNNVESTQNERGYRSQNTNNRGFNDRVGKNPAHDGSNVSQQQVEEAQAVEETSASSSNGVDKTSGGNCPGSNIIAQLLQDLVAALEATRQDINTQK